MSAVIDHLSAVPLFRGLPESALEAVAGLASETQFTDGDTVTREGDEGDAFFVVVDGRLVVTRNGMTIRDLGPGDFLGEISLIDGRPRTATVTAAGPVKALCVRRTDFLELMERYGAVRLGVLMALTDRVRGDEEWTL
jgi:CRP/FNR family transcriptional regulator/CRP/FNR family cyclic AMP-dependent transcriptional regulator